MNTIQAMLDEMVALLKERLPQTLKVEECPARVREYDIGEYDAAVVVHYRGSKYANRPDAPNQVQMRAIDLDVHIITRGLAGPTGANALVDDVRLALAGQSFGGALPLVVIEDGFAEESGTTWTYTVSFRGGIATVARRAAPPTFVQSVSQGA